MPTIHDWITMFMSQNPEVKVRAARGILQHADEAPLALLIEILETLSNEGLGADIARAIMNRHDREMVPTMIALLESNNDFARAVACHVLGQLGDWKATPHLLRMIDDTCVMVRRAAGFGLAQLKDPSSLAELKAKLKRHLHDDSNVVAGLQFALQCLGESESCPTPSTTRPT